MTDLSPAARAVWEAFNSKFDWAEDGVPGPQFHSVAAALRAAAERAGQIPAHPVNTDWEKGFADGARLVYRELLTIAAELEKN